MLGRSLTFGPKICWRTFSAAKLFSLRGKSSLPNQNKLLCWEIGWCGLSWLAWIFKSNFHCLIRPYLEKLFSKSLMKLGDGLMTSKSECQRTSGPQKRTKSDFMYCSQYFFAILRNLVNWFCASTIPTWSETFPCCLKANMLSLSVVTSIESWCVLCSNLVFDKLVWHVL